MHRRISRLIGISLLLTLFSSVPASDAAAQDNVGIASEMISSLGFRSLGPAFNGGRVLDLAVDPDNRHTWYLAVASGGVWKTTNAGTTWDPIFDEQGSYSIGTVVIDPNDSS